MASWNVGLDMQHPDKCPLHMCDGSGWRDVGWHLLTPCYCAAGRARKRSVELPEPATRPMDRPLELAEKVARFPRIQKAGV